MNRRKKAGSNQKPSAPTKPTAPTSSTPATASAMPPRVSPPPKPVAISQNGPLPPKATQPLRATVQQPKPTTSSLKPPLINMSTTRTTAPPAKPVPSQKHVLTRSDRVRMEWYDFEEVWVKPRQSEVEKQLEQLLETAEKTSRVKGKALEQHKDKIVNAMQRDFALTARAEWERRLDKSGLQAEDWADITVDEMITVEQVLSCEEIDAEPGVFASTQQHMSAVPTLSGKTIVEDSPPMSSHSFAGRTAQATPLAASQKAKSTQPQSAWTSWVTGTRQVSVTEVPEEPPTQKMASAWGAKKNAPIIEEIRTIPKAVPAPQSPPQTSQPAQRAPQPALTPPRPITPPSLPTHGLLVYPIPISLTMSPLDNAESSDPAFARIVDNAYVNSIREFHDEAAKADAALARALRKPIPASERDWTLRAHMMTMEQIARKFVENRDAMIDKARRQHGFGGSGSSDGAPPSAPKASTVQQPPGAFPDERIRVAPVPEPEIDPDVEIEREPEPDVDEVIEIPLKGKAAKRKGKKAAPTNVATNGRSTPTPGAAAAARPSTPTAKAAPANEKKAIPAVSAWSQVKAATAARPASPAPISTKVAPTPPPTTNGRGTPISPSMSPWEASQAAKAVNTTGSKPPSPPNGMWAPPMTRATSSKNPYAPTRPSRLAQVSEPESPGPPSPPPTREPTGKDYVAWFAGSSSEDEGGAEEAGLSEDDDEDEDEDEDLHGGETGASGFGGLLSSLAGASPWALFGENNQPQRERGREASPARGRGMAATPTPAIPAARRFAADPSSMGAGAGAEWMRWTPSDLNAGPSSSFGSSPLGYGVGPSAAKRAPGRQWESEEDNLDDMLEFASKTLDQAAMGRPRGGGANIEEAMAMFVTAQKARETLATPVGGRNANMWRR